MNWQPIETAPKDGTEILAYIPMDGINICYWNSSGWNYVSGHASFELDPTHWMPLPEPPIELQQGQSHSFIEIAVTDYGDILTTGFVMTYIKDTLKVIDFIQKNTLSPCIIDNELKEYHDLCFWDGIKTTNGTLAINPDVAHPGDLLHEAGHLAILPVAARTALSGDNLGGIEFTEAYQACFAIDQRLGYATDSAATGCKG